MSSGDVKVPRMLRLREVEAVTGIERWRLYDLLSRGEGPRHIRIGRVIRISETALADWIAAREKQAEA